MADFGGGIPGQIVSELTSIPKAVVKDTAKAFGSIATGIAEKVVTAATPQTPMPAGEGKVAEAGQASSDPMAAMKTQKEAAAKRRLAEVRGELQDYFEQQKRKKEQEEVMAEEQKKQEEVQIKQSKKKQEEKEVLRRLSSQYGGTSEVAKSGN